MLKVLFLDLDGVLNTHKWWRERPPKHPEMTKFERDISPYNIGILNEVLAATGAKVVVSSTWRKNFTLKQLQEGLASVGFTGEIIDVTPDLSGAPKPSGYLWSARARGDEIEQWLSKMGDPRPVFAIVDDDGDMGEHKPRLVQTDHEDGLTEVIAVRLIAMLGGRTNE